MLSLSSHLRIFLQAAQELFVVGHREIFDINVSQKQTDILTNGHTVLHVPEF